MRKYFAALSLESVNSCRGLFLILLLPFIVVAFRLALYVSFDYSDSFQFLLQAKSLVDPSFAFVTYDRSRPRALVMLLAGIESVGLLLKGVPPSIAQIHCVMVLVTMAYIFTWNLAISKMTNKLTAWIVSIFLVCECLLLHYSFTILTDIFAGLLWAFTQLSFLSFFRVLQGETPRFARDTFLSQNFISRQKLNMKSLVTSFLLALFGALTALSRHNLFPALPILLGVALLCCLRRPMDRRKYTRLLFPCVVVLLSYLVFVDIGLRIFGKGSQGLSAHFSNLHIQWREAVEARTEQGTYLFNLYFIFGPVFWILSLLSFISAALCSRMATEKIGPFWHFQIANLVLLILLQLIGHLEVRYLIPFLPGILALVALSAIEFSKRLPRIGKAIWAVLWIVALIHPIRKTKADLELFFSMPAYPAFSSDGERLWKYLKQKTEFTNPCTEIRTCLLPYYVHPTSEMRWDQGYRGYYFFFLYPYFTQIPTVRLARCPPGDTVSLQRWEHWENAHAAGSCYVFRQTMQLPFAPLTVLKPTTGNYDGTQTRASHPDSSIHCHPRGALPVACFEVKNFFEDDQIASLSLIDS